MNMNLPLNLIPFIPEILLASLTLIILIAGLYGKIHKAAWWLAGACIISCLFLVYKNPLFLTKGAILGGLANDYVTIWLKGIVLSFTLLIFLFYGGMTRVKVWNHGYHEFVVIVMIATIGSLITLSARHFLILYVAIELTSLSSYVLAAYSRERRYSVEAGMKYFILGSLSSCIMIFGMSLIYGFSGSLSFVDLTNVLNQQYTVGLLAGIFILLIGILFKLSIAPFHFWTPDIYQGAPFISVAFFTSVPKIAALGALINILKTIAPIKEIWSDYLIVFALLSMVVGGVGAIVQTSFKRLMGYSTILNQGFVLLALSCATTEGYSAAIIYQIIYSVACIGLFATLAITIVPSANDYPISWLAGFGVVKKLAALCISIFMFSMVGIPPFAGFFGKFYVISAVLEKHYYISAIIAILMTVISCYYYINIVRVMYFMPPEGKQIRLHESSALAFVIFLCTIFIVLFPLTQHLF